jgi:uncharacterized protein YndB with AHSA1/START domain
MIFIYAFFGIIALTLLIAWFMPNRYDVHQSMVIKAPVSKVFEQVTDLHHFHEWNPWQRMDPNPKAEVKGQPKTVGHSYSWEGKKIGVGSLTIRAVQQDKSVDFDLEFIKPWKSKADDGWVFEAIPEGYCRATWKNSGELPFPVARLMGPMIKKQLNQQFVQGLNNLREACEV